MVRSLDIYSHYLRTSDFVYKFVLFYYQSVEGNIWHIVMSQYHVVLKSEFESLWMTILESLQYMSEKSDPGMFCDLIRE